MAYNSIEEIKDLLLLESENQTLTDAQIQSYINDANTDMISELKRAIELDTFTATCSGTNNFTPFFNVESVDSVRVKSSGDWVELDEDEYRLIRNNDVLEVDDLKVGDKIELYSIPPNYKMLERAMTIVSIRTRFNPFKNQTIDPLYATWTEKKTNFLKALRSKFGAAKYGG